MEHSRRILRKIASTSQQVITAANEYVDRKGLFNVELRVHLQLEEEMQKVAVACESLATILPMSLQSHGGPAFDEGLKDWLTAMFSFSLHHRYLVGSFSVRGART